MRIRNAVLNNEQIDLLKKIVFEWPVDFCYPGLDIFSDIAGIDFKEASVIISIIMLTSGMEFVQKMPKIDQIIAMLKLRSLSNILSHAEATAQIIAVQEIVNLGF